MNIGMRNMYVKRPTVYPGIFYKKSIGRMIIGTRYMPNIITPASTSHEK